MGILDSLLGRTKPVAANLDRLFGLSSAAITLEASENFVPTGQAGVCFKPATGQNFAETEREVASMLEVDATDAQGKPTVKSAKLSENLDEYGYRWVVVGGEDFDTLVTRVHFVNSTLVEHGYGPQLLCSVVGFAKKPDSPSAAIGPASIYLVYLFKRGSFYPFVPTGPSRRDNEAELRLKNELSGDLNIEPDLDRWFPLWNLPVL